MITEEIKEYIDRSVLCWLSTVDTTGVPNVSPKETFSYYKEKLLIAHIASPNSIKNIRHNPNVCVSFIDIFIQKGFKLKGKAEIIIEAHDLFKIYYSLLSSIYSDKLPIKAVIEVTITHVSRIVAPSYFFFPETKEEDQIASAKELYLKKIYYGYNR